MKNWRGKRVVNTNTGCVGKVITQNTPERRVEVYFLEPNMLEGSVDEWTEWLDEADIEEVETHDMKGEKLEQIWNRQS